MNLNRVILMADDFEEIKGVGQSTQDKLYRAGYETYESVAATSASKLQEKADLGETTAKKVIQGSRDRTEIGGFSSADEMKADAGRITTIVDEVDDILGGGIREEKVTEFYGEFGSGKSQIVHQIAVNVQLPKSVGGRHGRPVIIDTEETFTPQRVEDMVRGLDEEIMQEAMEAEEGIDADPDDEEAVDQLVENYLGRIEVATAQTTQHQILLPDKANELANEYADSDYPVRLVAVDSVTSLFRAEFVGRGALAERQQKLSRHLKDLRELSKAHGAAIVLTNQVQANPDQMFGNPEKPIGGNILGHTSTYRIWLKKSKEDKRIATVVDAPDLPAADGVFRITSEGLKSEDY